LDDRVDASNIEVAVKDGEVTLSGTVTSRDDKHRTEDLIERVSGVKGVSNTLRVSAPLGASSMGQSEGRRAS
jgi:osmotically-inducible protein OsmY